MTSWPKSLSQACMKGCWPLMAVLAMAAALLTISPVQAQQSTPAVAASSDGPLDRIKRLFAGEPELLPPEKAFTVNLRAADNNTLIANFAPVEGYYLYRERLQFRVLEPQGMQVSGVQLPKGKIKADPNFGDVEVYTAPFEARIQLAHDAAAPVSGRLFYSYQGCSESGVCYPPIEKEFLFTLTAAGDAGGSADAVVSAAADDAGSFLPGWLDPERSAALFAGGNALWVVAAFFGFGLLLSLTPCVWPMIPILSGIIAGQGADLGRGKAFMLSSAYVLGMAVVYAIAGVAAGLSGSLLSAALQTPWVLGGMALVFVALALSMFGLYELQMPAFLQSRLAAASNRISKRTIFSVFAMGGVSAIIVGPCVAAPLAGALLYISQTQDVALGGLALFAMALGHGVPLLVVGTSLGGVLPRTGAWMGKIKAFLGVLLLGAAIWMISPFLSLSIVMGLAGALLVFYAVQLRAFDALPAHAGGAARVGKGLGMVTLLIGAMYLVGAFSGSRDFFQPLAGLTGVRSEQVATALPFRKVASVEELQSVLEQNKGRYAMLDFYADWCVSCKEMERFTFSDAAVQNKLRDVLLLKTDVTANSAQDKALLARFGLFGPPGIIFFDANAGEIKSRRVIGFMEAGRFLRVLEQVFPLKTPVPSIADQRVEKAEPLAQPAQPKG
jgi:thiol:disulfide interchange protein DsbD